ncbi:unnamed protein product [Schistocephalus solidus]|uniref:Gag-pol polyprotein n=1 Tax=Schistocephalus solidus TaxID=70667 RepID=A0A183SSZ9_SCHSO|nr:unnamed protein product [Schistocephalus solidus]
MVAQGREKGGSLRTEKRNGSFGYGTQGALLVAKKVFPSFRSAYHWISLALRVIPKLLLHKAATLIEGCLVCSGRAISVGFVHLVLLDEQSVDGCVVVIEPILVLTTCVAEDIQGGVGQDQAVLGAVLENVGCQAVEKSEELALIRKELKTADEFEGETLHARGNIWNKA